MPSFDPNPCLLFGSTRAHDRQSQALPSSRTRLATDTMTRMAGVGVRQAMVAVGAIVAVAVGALFGVADADSQGTPALSVDANRFAGPVPLRVKFSADTSQATGAVSYRWCFDDGTQSQDQNPTHSFPRAGYYKVVVQAQDESGDQDRQSLLLGAWPPKQWAAAQRKRPTKKAARRAQRVQQQRTTKRRKELQRRHGLTREKCTGQPFQ
jgi:hypothetical protein